MTRKIKIILLLLCLSTGIRAQQYQAALVELAKVTKSYADSGYTSFNVKYQYAKMSAPATLLDTLSAVYKYKSKRFYCKIGNIEFTQNDSFNVTAYGTEKILVLSNAVSNITQGGVPTDKWDSSFAAANFDSAKITTSGSNKILQFFFNASSEYKSCSLEYNATSYQPQKFTYTKNGSMYYPDTSAAMDGIIVTVLFSGYSKATFSEIIFDTAKYVQRQNGSWVPTAAYSTYQFVNNYFEPVE